MTAIMLKANTAPNSETVHKLCCFTTKDAGKNKLLFAGKSVYLFGDLLQLPAVENPQVFQSPLWKHFQMWYHSKKTVCSLKIWYMQNS